MRAYEMRPDGVTARVFDSADSMKHHSLTEEQRRKGGRAHRRSRISRFSVLSNARRRAIGDSGPGTTEGRVRSTVRCEADEARQRGRRRPPGKGATGGAGDARMRPQGPPAPSTGYL